MIESASDGDCVDLGRVGVFNVRACGEYVFHAGSPIVLRKSAVRGSTTAAPWWGK